MMMARRTALAPVLLLLLILATTTRARQQPNGLQSQAQRPWRPWRRIRQLKKPSNNQSQRTAAASSASDAAVSKQQAFGTVPGSSGLTTTPSTAATKSHVELTASPLGRSPSQRGLGAAVLSILQKPGFGKWSLVGVQLLLGYYLGRAVFDAGKEVLNEIASLDSAGETAALPKAMIVKVLEDVQENRPSNTMLHQVVQRLTVVTNWSLWRPPASEPQVASIESLLYSLTKPEYNLLQQCLYIPPSSHSPQDNKSKWTKINGINDIQQALLDRLSSMRYCPAHNPYAKLLEDQNAGILLYGPPGCGKSALLEALCSSVKMPCLILAPSNFLKKFVGETNSQIRALFSLCSKLGDCVVLLDELDGLFRERREDEHDVIRELKTEFLQHWDGVSKEQSKMLLIGATNRPFEVDAAVLRRMSQSHFVGLPQAPARMAIIQSLLNDIPTSGDVSVQELVASTEGYSPSDLNQLIRTAVLQGPLRDARHLPGSAFRSLSGNDVMRARQQVGPTPLSPGYKDALIAFTQRHQHHHSGGGGNNNGGQMMVQSTPFGNFYHAGTYSAQAQTQQGDEDDSLTSTDIYDWIEDNNNDDSDYNDDDGDYMSDDDDDDDLL